MQAQAISEPGENRQIYREAVSQQFGRYLSAARRHAGLSQQALADQAYIHRDEVSRFERGMVCPRLDTVLRLSASLHDDPVKFLMAVAMAVKADG
jgi:ribosome-binding protein aMBF1 (putative translation factor)